MVKLIKKRSKKEKKTEKSQKPVGVAYRELIFTDQADLFNMQENYEIPAFVVSSLLSAGELSHIRLYEDKYYLILSFPATVAVMHPQNITLQPLAIILDEQSILFVHGPKIDLSQFFLNLSEINPVGILYEFLTSLFETLQQQTAYIVHEITHIENDVLASPDNAEIKELFNIQKVVISFQTVLNGLIDTLDTFQSYKEPNILLDDDYADNYTDIRIECDQLAKTTDMLNGMLSSLMDTASSIQANNLSIRMKTLTALTIIISIPTFITGFYSMNVDAPFQNHPYSLWIVSGITLFITIVVTVYLYKKDLF